MRKNILYYSILYLLFLSIIVRNGFAQTYHISIPVLTVPGTQSQVTVPINITENLTGQNITSYQGVITWNNNVIQYSNHVHTGTLTEPWGTSGWTENPSSGSLNFGQFVTQPALTGSGTIVNLIFNIVGQPGDNTPINFSSFYLNVIQTITTNGSVTIQSTTQNPDIDVVPPSWDYTNVNIGNTPEKTFVVSNVGGAPLEVSGTSIIGTNANQFLIVSGGGPFTISAGSSRNLVVRFKPTSTGSKSATLRVSSNDPDENSKDISLIGTGVSQPQDIDVNPLLWDYGSVNIGNILEKTFVLSNTGGTVLNVTATSLTGTNANQFFIVSGGGSFTISAGDSRNLIVRFMPTSIGSKNATLRISSNDPDENPKDITLSGIGTQVSTVTYIVKRIPQHISPPVIDGILNESFWSVVDEDTLTGGGVPDEWGGEMV